MNKRSYFLGIAAMLVLLLALLTGTALAADEEIAGADFNDGKMHWSISSAHVLTISGTGEMPSYRGSENPPWYSYRDQIERIVVEDGISVLGDYSFSGCSSVTSVSLPNSLNELGAGCFFLCLKLETINLPSSIHTFKESAFYYCSSLTTITIPEGVTELTASNLFDQCNSLTSITLPSTLKKLGGDYFSNTFYHTVA